MEGILSCTYSSFSPFRSGSRGHILNCELMLCAFLQSCRAFFFPSFASLTIWHAAQQETANTRPISLFWSTPLSNRAYTTRSRSFFFHIKSSYRLLALGESPGREPLASQAVTSLKSDALSSWSSSRMRLISFASPQMLKGFWMYPLHPRIIRSDTAPFIL